MSQDISSTRQELRKSLRQKRRALSQQQQSSAAQNVAQQLVKLPLYAHSQNIAAYIASDGELGLQPSIERILEAGKRCYLPRVMDTTTMEFRSFARNTRLVDNRFGIPEPAGEVTPIAPQDLDLVLLPLVGFCRTGGRLGMGGGFYDRCFAFKAEQEGSGPALIGIAHSLQELSELPVESWDIPLSGILTDQGYIPVK
ncbi:5-formyltetrahydrofolate cyclo-ligase [Pseudoteredinibacter isoporae]|uniref:5-formyltetrahydrofolate cyclo-ligase n=1 Tax=Pseudoteredinibacter isoporae TaxID=570281 RepID=A0A7X0JPM4_9GAMM|nr:5-formyltetrahydrofolate cyclo-ligase [Pseudoteredinibacter isoporae]MBB6519954.1 5-formyltetrahydrofolate cyclo-ligase [Pseudoteredinibacter isoporae]NHO85527.1 5-formyltetrahydrofolate cyclo-ligase [Pseudoteredinibacter isoporae]NIB26021.1 5-formyltetrahydrofolate cyclo-ligase [Pseudoteredinibacter isoporae]